MNKEFMALKGQLSDNDESTAGAVCIEIYVH